MLNTKNFKRTLLVGTALTMINPTLVIAGKKGKGAAAADPKNVVVYTYKTSGVLGSTSKVTQEHVELFKGKKLKDNNKFVKHINTLLKKDILTANESALLKTLDIYDTSKVAKGSVAAGGAPAPASPIKDADLGAAASEKIRRSVLEDMRGLSPAEQKLGSMTKVTDKTTSKAIAAPDVAQLVSALSAGDELTGRNLDLFNHLNSLKASKKALTEQNQNLLNIFDLATKKHSIKVTQEVTAKAKADEAAARVAAAEKAKADAEAAKLAADAKAKADADAKKAKIAKWKSAFLSAAKEKKDADAAIIAAEERAREEAARVAAEEKARDEATRLAAEEKARDEAVKLAAEAKIKADADAKKAKIAKWKSAFLSAAKEKKDADAARVAAAEKAKAERDSKLAKIKAKRAEVAKAREEATRVAVEERAREDAAAAAPKADDDGGFTTIWDFSAGAEDPLTKIIETNEKELVAVDKDYSDSLASRNILNERAAEVIAKEEKRLAADAKTKEEKKAANLKAFENMFGKAKKKSNLSKAKTLDDAIPSKASTTELKPISFDDTKREVTIFSGFDPKANTAKIKAAEAKLGAAAKKLSDAEGAVLDLFAEDHEITAREESISVAKDDMKAAEKELNELKAKIKESGKKALAPVVEKLEVGVAKVEAKSAEDKLITSEDAINAANSDVEAKKTALEEAKNAFDDVATIHFNPFNEMDDTKAEYNAAKAAFENAEADLVAAEKVLADAKDAKIELVAKKEEAEKTIEAAKLKSDKKSAEVKALLAKAKEIKAEKEAEQAAKKKELIVEESDVIEIQEEKLKSTQYVKEVSKVIFSKLKGNKDKVQQKIKENDKLLNDEEKKSLSIDEENLSKIDLEYLKQETDQIFEKVSNDEKATQKIAEDFLISMNNLASNPDSFEDLQNNLEDDEKSSEMQKELSDEQIDLALAFNDAAKSSEERNRIEKSGTQAAEDNAKVAKELSKTPQTVTARVADQKLSRILNRTFGAAQGVAAGDSLSPRLDNVWVKGIIGKANQGAKNNHSGYNGNNAGFTVGSDLELNDKTIIGIAYSNMNSNFKFKNSRSGDKISGRGHMFSVYSIYEFNDRWSMDAIVSAGKTDIKSKRLATGNRTANAKINNQNFNAEANVNYRIPFSSLVLIPNAGLKYGYFKDKAYKEKGAGQYNMNVASTTNSTVIGVVGIDAMMPYNLSENTKIIPTLHASIENELSSKKSDVKFKWRNKNFTVKPEDSSDDKLSFNIGGGLTAQRNNIELSADYNCNLQKKYTNHQGSLKLKLSF